MKYHAFPITLLAAAGVAAFFGYPVVAAGAVVAAGLFAIADALQGIHPG